MDRQVYGTSQRMRTGMSCKRSESGLYEQQHVLMPCDVRGSIIMIPQDEMYGWWHDSLIGLGTPCSETAMVSRLERVQAMPTGKLSGGNSQKNQSLHGHTCTNSCCIGTITISDYSDLQTSLM